MEGDLQQANPDQLDRSITTLSTNAIQPQIECKGIRYTSDFQRICPD